MKCEADIARDLPPCPFLTQNRHARTYAPDHFVAVAAHDPWISARGIQV
jgi:hypothetical protein